MSQFGARAAAHTKSRFAPCFPSRCCTVRASRSASVRWHIAAVASCFAQAVLPCFAQVAVPRHRPCALRAATHSRVCVGCAHPGVATMLATTGSRAHLFRSPREADASRAQPVPQHGARATSTEWCNEQRAAPETCDQRDFSSAEETRQGGAALAPRPACPLARLAVPAADEGFRGQSEAQRRIADA
jgi:hypothetical protein